MGPGYWANRAFSRVLGGALHTGFKAGKVGAKRAKGALGRGARGAKETARDTINFAPGIVIGTARGAIGVVEDVANIAAATTRIGYRAATASPLGGRIPLFAPELLGTHRTLPFQLSAAMQNRLVGGALGAGAIAGLGSAMRNEYKGYRAEVSPSGRLEVTRDDMMGASGDLTLSLYSARK